MSGTNADKKPRWTPWQILWGVALLVFLGLSFRKLQLVGIFLSAGMLCHHTARNSTGARSGWFALASWVLVAAGLIALVLS